MTASTTSSTVHCPGAYRQVLHAHPSLFSVTTITITTVTTIVLLAREEETHAAAKEATIERLRPG
jgi:hypothetical protein